MSEEKYREDQFIEQVRRDFEEWYFLGRKMDSGDRYSISYLNNFKCYLARAERDRAEIERLRNNEQLVELVEQKYKQQLAKLKSEPRISVSYGNFQDLWEENQKIKEELKRERECVDLVVKNYLSWYELDKLARETQSKRKCEV